MQRISIVHDQPANQRVASLWRAEPHDHGRHHYTWFFGRNSREWNSGVRDQYSLGFWPRSGSYNRDLSMAWAYLFLFSDGEAGACRVCDVNDALRALGCSIDMSAEPTDERR